MSKTHPSKSKAVKKSAPAKAPAKKAAARPAPKNAPAKAVKKAAPAKPAKKAAVKKAPAKKVVAPAKKAPVKKVAAKPAPAKKAAPVKKATPPAKAKKAVPAKKAPAAKAAPPAKKAPVKKAAPAPALAKKAVPAKKGAPAKKAAPVQKAAKPAPVAKVAPPPPVPAKAEPVVVAVSVPAPAAPAAAPAPKPKPAPVKAAAPAKSGKKSAAAPVEVVSEPPRIPRVPVISTEKPEPTKTGALFYDSHMHTPLCKHAWGEPEEYAAQALKAGLKGIIFTCHCPMPNGYWPTVRMAEGEFDTYVSLVQRAAEAYKGKLDVGLGLESEFFPGAEKWIEQLHQRADFDYLLGGLHWQAKEYLAKYEIGTIENFRRIYFDHLALSAETGLYDCVAHPDLVKNYHPDSWCFAIIKNTVATSLDRIAKTGVAMELNTSGLNKSYAEMNPGNEMLRMMAERKIPVVIGSDSHKALRVGEHFITALNNLAEAGYEEVSYFKKRERIDLKIPDVLASLRKAIDANA